MPDIVGNSGNELLVGGAGADRLWGGAGDDELRGGGGDDVLDGQFGDDLLLGGAGNDSLIDLLGGNDRLFGEDGDDSLRVIDLAEDDIARTLLLNGGAGDDRLRIDFRFNRASTISLVGGEGNDRIIANGGGAVTIDAGAGNDVVTFNAIAGDDSLAGTLPASELTSYRITLGPGSDTMQLLSSRDLDWLAAAVTAGDREETFSGTAFNVIIVTDFRAGAGGDRIDLIGFLRDRYDENTPLQMRWDPALNPFATGHLRLVRAGADTQLQARITYTDDIGRLVNVYRLLVTLQGVTAGSLIAANLSGFDPAGATIGSTVTGTAGNDELHGLSGADQLIGGGGNDALFGGAGDDILDGGDGNDVIDGEFGNDVLSGGAGNDRLSDDLGGNDFLFGNDGDDALRVIDLARGYVGRTLTLDGGAGNDVIRADFRYNIESVLTLNGGDGDDVISADGGGQVRIDAGSGNDLVEINVVAGYDALNAPLPAAELTDYRVTLGSRRDTLRLLSASDLDWRALGGPPDTVTDGFGGTAFHRLSVSDFATGPGGDRIDLIGFLHDQFGSDTDPASRWDPATNPFAIGHLRLVQAGADAQLQIRVTYSDPNSGQLVFAYRTVITFVGVATGSLDAANLGGFDPGGATLAIVDSGTAGNDALTGLSGADTLSGGGGDVLRGGAGNDVLNGGDGSDVLDGGPGDDRAFGGAGDDRLSDNLGGNDLLSGGDGDDVLRVIDLTGGLGPVRTLTLDGGTGNDSLRLDLPFDHVSSATLIGGDGKDVIAVDGGGVVTIDAGAGDDLVEVNVVRRPDAASQSDTAPYRVALGAGVDTLRLLSHGEVEWLAAPGRNSSDTELFSGQRFKPIIVTDFAPGLGGDRIDVLGFLKDRYSGPDPMWHWDPATNPFATGFLKLVQVRPDVEIDAKVRSVDPSTGVISASYSPIIILQRMSIIAMISENSSGFTVVNSSGQPGVTLLGTPNDDFSFGTNGDDRLEGQAGNDVLLGKDGDDYLDGGADNDFLLEDDGVAAGFGNDIYIGGTGIDRLSYFSSTGNLTVDLRLQGVAQNTGITGTDTISSIEYITATKFNDNLIGNEANNWFWTFTGNDTLSGNGGDDLFSMGAGTKIVDGGTGVDTVQLLEETNPNPDFTAAGINLSLLLQGTAQATGFGSWTLTNVENLAGSTGRDVLTGDDNANVLMGGQGDDRLIGNGGDDVLLGDGNILLAASNSAPFVYFDTPFGTGNGNDFLDGGAGNDRLVGGAGDDILVGGSGADVLDGGTGFDYASYASSTAGLTVDLQFASPNNGDAAGDTFTSIEGLQGSAFADSLRGDQNANILLGNDGNDTLFGRDGDDSLLGGAGGDNLYGEAGSDVLDGGTGADTLDGGAGFDYASYTTAAAGLTADLQFASQNSGDAAGDSYTSIEGLQGSVFADSLRGDQNANTLYGNGGDDFLFGRAGDDTLLGGAGSDSLFGEAGADVLYGGADTDYLYGGDGGDTLIGEGGFDYALYTYASSGVIADLQFASSQNSGEAAGDSYTSIEGLVGTSFNDSLRGDAGNNILSGNDGTDILFGRDGDDTLLGGAGNDSLYGEAGSDSLDGGSGADVLDGGTGFDYASYASSTAGLTVDLQFASPNNGDAAGDTFTSIEGLQGSAFADSLRGDQNANILLGNDGNDTLFGRDGDDSLLGGAGGDNLYGEAGSDVLDGGTGADTLDGGAGFDYASYTTAAAGLTADLQFASQNSGDAAGDSYTSIEGLQGSVFADSLRGDQNANTLYGNGGDDFLFGRAGDDTLLGGAGSDSLFGEAGADVLYGGADTDYLYGGDGGDTLIGEGGFDYALYSYASTGVTADLQFASGQNSGEASGDSYTAVEGLVGSNFNDSLRGDAGNNYLWGGSGDDVLYGRDGSDVLLGNSGNDALYGGAGNDIFVFGIGDGSDTIGDFEAGNGPGDVIQLSRALGVSSYAEVQAHAAQVGANVVITFDNGQILTILNVQQFGLAVDDFGFVG